MGANQMQDGRNNGVIPDGERTYLTTVLPTALTLERFLRSQCDAEDTRARQVASTRPLARLAL